MKVQCSECLKYIDETEYEENCGICYQCYLKHINSRNLPPETEILRNSLKI